MNVSGTKYLGELLVDMELITKEELEKALKVQNTTNIKIGEVLVSEGYVSQEDIIRVLEFKLGIPSINLVNYGVEQEACLMIPESMAKKYELIPIKKEKKILVVAMYDPLNVYAIDDVRIFSGMDVQPVIATLDDIRKAISKYYSTQSAIKAVQEYIDDNEIIIDSNRKSTKIDNIKNAPIVKLVNSIFEQAIRNNASDIHIEPLETVVKVRYRIDGHLKDVLHIDTKVLKSVITRIKISGNMNISEKRLPQDGRISIVIDGKIYDLRVSIIPVIFGEKIVMRVIDKEAFLIPKEKLGFDEEGIRNFNKLLEHPHGIILVTGPTGSGKSTTLYSAVQELNREDVNIVTVEDPVESIIDGINQIQVNPKIGLDFASGLRSILRQDPDVIMIGEIRDAETAMIAIRSAITGHLVLSTLHTNDAPGTVGRLVDMGIEPFFVASSLVGIIAQRLLRKICLKCKIKYTPKQEDLKLVGVGIQEDQVFYKGRGCPTCLGTGYKGRTTIHEILIISQKHREMINRRCTLDELREFSIKNGMKTLRDGAIKLVYSGVTTIDELKRMTYMNE